MFNFFHRLFNPHCEHCAEELRESRVCNSCEILKHELELLREENRMLLKQLLHPREETKLEIDTSALKPVLPHRMPWKVRQQSLEREDRHRAKLARDKEKEMSAPVEVADLEEALDIAQEERENQGAVSGSNA